ncbi:hypothetical protein Pa4123_20620 [Phytohabitans aurantiacus]|uniref:Uncharacterized protein n=1 Tax=Phytohabitans aurantiacus TaxID=3016789 RepID=A0ABQ5QQ71_9ACTN|nr:hypothetical protein Pa4123_20620 [Phytohabitans aurantiacus]
MLAERRRRDEPGTNIIQGTHRGGVRLPIKGSKLANDLSGAAQSEQRLTPIADRGRNLDYARCNDRNMSGAVALREKLLSDSESNWTPSRK